MLAHHLCLMTGTIRREDEETHFRTREHFAESRRLEDEIRKNLGDLGFDF